MKSIDAEHVAEELISIFARVGLPRDILTDQGTNFTSELLKRCINFYTLTVRKCVTQDGNDWDKLLLYVLFGYREAPHESTGFSPFELLYGQEVRGPLVLLKEGWEARTGASESVVSHVLMMRERLETMAGVVQQNMKEAQTRQKRWYDRTARERALQEGERLLVLLPTSTSKLLAQWHGSYDVLKRMEKVIYMVDMADKKKGRCGPSFTSTYCASGEMFNISNGELVSEYK